MLADWADLLLVGQGRGVDIVNLVVTGRRNEEERVIGTEGPATGAVMADAQ